jgi:hypothetical protein
MSLGNSSCPLTFEPDGIKHLAALLFLQFRSDHLDKFQVIIKCPE